ncbi:MAG: hypothetical protein ACRDYX_10885 [Egibacteraceae bacterium]
MAELTGARGAWAVLFAVLFLFGSRACWRAGGHLSVKGVVWDVVAGSLLVAAAVVLLLT